MAKLPLMIVLDGADEGTVILLCKAIAKVMATAAQIPKDETSGVTSHSALATAMLMFATLTDTRDAMYDAVHMLLMAADPEGMKAAEKMANAVTRKAAH